MGMAKPDKVPKGAVGFGDEVSRRGRTTTMNHFAMVTTTPTQGGADVTVRVRGGYAVMPEVEVLGDEVVIHLRKEYGPRIGERIMVRKRLVEVAERRWSGRGTLQVRDADTGAWMEVGE